MLDLRAMGTRHHLHASVLSDRRRQRDPGRDDIRRRQSPVGAVLVPGNVRRVTGILREELRSPAQQIGAQDILDRIQDAGVPDQLVHPRVQQVRLLVDPGRQPATMKRLRSFESRKQTARFRLRHHFDWKVNTVSTVGFHLFVRQHSPHVDAPLVDGNDVD